METFFVCCKVNFSLATDSIEICTDIMEMNVFFAYILQELPAAVKQTVTSGYQDAKYACQRRTPLNHHNKLYTVSIHLIIFGFMMFLTRVCQFIDHA